MSVDLKVWGLQTSLSGVLGGRDLLGFLVRLGS